VLDRGELRLARDDRASARERRLRVLQPVPREHAGHTARVLRPVLDQPGVGRGLDDRLHQPRREHLYPRSMALVRRARSLGALGATISGAGPTVLVWCPFEATGAVLAALREECAGWADVRALPFAATGADVVSF
jgi:homoserine kinase